MNTDLKQQIQQWRGAGKISLEMELLLAAISVNAAEQVRHWTKILASQDVRWDQLLTLAESHGVRPLLWQFFRQIGAPTVPAEVIQALRDFVQQNTLQNLAMTGELSGILGDFAKLGINVIPFKGPTLAVLAYENLALREFGDLDILLTRQNFPLAGNQMEKRGYQPEFNLATVLARGFLKVTNVLPFFHPTKDIKVELHWQIAPPMFPFPIRQERLWEGIQPVAAAGQQMETLATEVLLVYLCAHGAKHWWECLEWLADVAWLIHRHPDLDWDSVIELANAANCERQLWMGLLLARELLNAPLPEKISRQMQAATAAQKLAVNACEWLILEDGREPGFWQRCLFYAGLWKGVARKTAFAWEMIFSTTVADWQFLPLPGSLSFLYLLVRPVRLLKDKLS